MINDNKLNLKSKSWSRKHTQCVWCGKSEVAHAGLGFCKTCYNHLPQVIERKRVKNKKYRQTLKYRLSLQKYRSSNKYKNNYRLKFKETRILPRINTQFGGQFGGKDG